MAYKNTVLRTSLSVRSIISIHYFDYMSDFSFPGESHDFWELLQLERRLPEKKGLDGSGAVWYNQSQFSHAPVVKLADTMDLGSIPATGRGSSPLGRTSSEIPNTAPFPALRKTALCWEFLRFRAGFALLDSGPKGARGALMGECGPF